MNFSSIQKYIIEKRMHCVRVVLDGQLLDDCGIFIEWWHKRLHLR